jgi:hypothetical protein
MGATGKSGVLTANYHCNVSRQTQVPSSATINVPRGGTSALNPPLHSPLEFFAIAAADLCSKRRD